MARVLSASPLLSSRFRGGAGREDMLPLALGVSETCWLRNTHHDLSIESQGILHTLHIIISRQPPQYYHYYQKLIKYRLRKGVSGQAQVREPGDAPART